MKKQEFISEKLNEKYFFIKHKSGLSIYLYPKLDYNSCYSIFGTCYGSINETFKNSENVLIKTPQGVAHYLEHKLFESEECDSFKLFSKLGASANAYTSFDKTAYLFSCNDNFISSLKILLDFVQTPYFTNESVEKEREIINQEIKMYRDSPESRVTLNLLSNMYKDHPVKNDIAGSVESVSKITPEILYSCYNNFYNLKNMTLCVVGNINVDETLDCINNSINKNDSNNYKFIEPIFPKEQEEIINDYISEKMEISMPIFSLGFKEKISTKYLSIKEAIISEIALCALTLKSGKMYNELLNENLINTQGFSCEHFSGPYFSSSIFSGESKDPIRAANIIKDNTELIVKNGIDKDVFERSKICAYAESTSTFNSLGGIANILLDFSFSNYELFEYIDVISKITLQEVNEEIKKKFRKDFCVLSVITPKT